MCIRDRYTINPAIAQGISHVIGSVEVGKFADLVVWKPEFFGVKPEIIIKGGAVTASRMGDANASIPTVQPIIYKHMFGAHGACLLYTSLDDVENVSISFMTTKMVLKADEDKMDAVIAESEKIIKKIEPEDVYKRQI